jgi:NAD(P)-dependent dehydrogenase (short-subunit alcohol dehydrogenase family)
MEQRPAANEGAARVAIPVGVPVLDLFRLDGQVALVTGGGSGLGRALCLAMAEAGADVACVDVKEAEAQETAALVRQVGRRALAITADVTDEASVTAAFTAAAALGPLDVCFANAGVAERRAPLVEAPLTEWRRMIDVDLTGVFLTVREAARRMQPRRMGKIITTSSIQGFVSSHDVPTNRAYAAAKAGVVNFTRSVAVELAPHNIQVNGIAPTFMRTKIAGEKLSGQSEESRAFLRSIAERAPMGRVGEPDEIKGVAVFLASAASSLVTGATLPVDGGWLAV